MNYKDLSDDARKAFVNAVKTLKNNPPAGVQSYDEFVRQHKSVFESQYPPGHQGPGFLPWHREFLLRFEIALRKINPSVSLPYWDWTVDNSWQSPLWSDSFNFMGGNGSGPNDRVMTGPFAYNALTAISWKNGFVTATTTTAHGVQVGQSFQIGGVAPSGYNGTFQARTGTTGNTLVYALDTNPGTATVLGGTGWVLNILPTGQADPFLKRSSGDDPLGITPDDVSKVLQSTPYDRSPWNTVLEGGFRPDLEWGVHTRAHDWVGGSMASSCSPNDPVFWLHHCNIDRLWARWQIDGTKDQSGAAWPYLPPSGTVNTTFSCSANSSTITVASAAGIFAGVVASGPGIPANTMVENVSGTTITLSQKTTAAETNAVGTFALAWLGHGLDDPMMPPRDGETFSPTPHCVLNHRALGYRYDATWPYTAISWTVINSDGTVGSYWRAYGIDSSDRIYQKSYNNGILSGWVPVTSGGQTVSGKYVAADIWPGSGDPANPPVHLYVVNNTQMRQYIWDGSNWINPNLFDMNVPIESVAVVSWQNGYHRRLYYGIGTRISVLRYDGGEPWIPDLVASNRTLVSAISWEDKSGTHIRLHVWNENQNEIRVLASSDGESYVENQLP